MTHILRGVVCLISLGAGATGEDSAGGADDVAGTHLSCNGGSQSLEGGHAAGLRAPLELEVAEGLLHSLTEATDLHEAGTDTVPQTHTDEQEHQDVVGQVLVDFTYNGIQYFFNHFFISFCIK